MASIAFVGLGHMGAPMATNLLNAGHELIIYDLSSEACQVLKAKGAKIANSAGETARDADVVFTMLQTGKQVSDVCIGKNGLFSYAKPGTLFIDCSSIDVDTSREITKTAIAKGFGMVDAPVSGGVTGATNATLTIMVGGDTKSFERAEPILKQLGKNILHAGPSGNGQVAKICNNMILGISMIAVSEAFTLGEKLGLDPHKLFDISSKASGSCWVMTQYNPVPGILENVPANHDYKPGFTANMMLKDLMLSQTAAQSVAATTPLGNHATELYKQFVENGNGELDFSGIIKQIT
jgi:3-hydroxyisobutyrate dehydrogenase